MRDRIDYQYHRAALAAEYFYDNCGDRLSKMDYLLHQDGTRMTLSKSFSNTVQQVTVEVVIGALKSKQFSLTNAQLQLAHGFTLRVGWLGCWLIWMSSLFK